MKWILCTLPLLLPLPALLSGTSNPAGEASVTKAASAVDSGFTNKAPAPWGPELVELKTADGQIIHGYYFAAGPHDPEHDHSKSAQDYADVPAVVLLHMYRSDKMAWEPIMSHFRLAGLATLAIDMRGHGASKLGPDGSDLSKNVENRDADLFNDMWQDGQAAVDWLKKRGHKLPHIGLMGASVGCSVAIDCARRNPDLNCVAVLTPGKKYLGVDSLQHVKNWGSRELLLVSSREEFDKGAGPIDEALRKHKNARVESWVLPDRGIHGTRMLNRIPNIEARLAMWFLGRIAPPQDYASYFVPMEQD